MRARVGARVSKRWLGARGELGAKQDVALAALTELCWILGDGAGQAARVDGGWMTSVPSWKVTPATTLGNWVSPFSRRQVFAAAITSLNTISRAVACESAPLVRTVRCRTGANTLSI